MSGKKKGKPARPAKSKPAARGPLGVSGGLHWLDLTLLPIAFIHAMLFLVLLVTIGNFHNRDAAPVGTFGMQEAEEQQAAETGPERTRPFSTPVAVAYILFTLVAWGLLGLRHKELDPRGLRFAVLMLVPGSLVACFALAQYFIYS